MGEGLKQVAKQCGGLTVKAGGKTAHYNADGKMTRMHGEARMSWCTTCGKDTPARATICADCRKWWEENPPPADNQK